jgi:transcriptional regulator with XRE-family HTH domain
MPSNRVREVRLQHHLTQEKVARLADVSLRTVTRFEQGESVTLRKAQAIARALGVTVDELFEEVPA